MRTILCSADMGVVLLKINEQIKWLHHMGNKFTNVNLGIGSRSPICNPVLALKQRTRIVCNLEVSIKFEHNLASYFREIIYKIGHAVIQTIGPILATLAIMV